MKVDGQSSFWFDIFGQGKFDEATVKRESSFDFGSFRTKNKLSIDAGDGDDVITVKKTGDDEYEVSINGQKYQLTKEEMKNLELDGGAGNDKIIIDESVDIAIKVKGGAGDDTIVNRADGISIDGGEGNDRIVSLADACDISGGRGDDVIDVIGDGNKVSGSGPKTFWDFFQLFHHENDKVHVEGTGNSVE